MKNWIFLVGFLISTVAVADVGPDDLTYRKSDPFLFCHQGQDVKQKPLRCWSPIAPFTGAWMTSPWCKPVMTYGKDWDQDDELSLKEYLRVCPKAITSGEWTGTFGGESLSPMQH